MIVDMYRHVGSRKMRLSISFVLGLLLASIFTLPAFANSNPEPIAVIKVSHGEHYVGDPILLTVEITHAIDQIVIFPQLEGQWGNFRVVNQSKGEIIAAQGGFQTTTYDIDVRVFRTGRFETDPLHIKLSDPDGNLIDVFAPPVAVEISSVLVAGDEQLRDIKPQASIPQNNPLIWLGIAGSSIAVLLGVSFFYRRRQSNGRGRPLDTRLPYEIAFAELDRIEQMHLPEQSAFKGHYTLVADCLKEYIHDQYQVTTHERTTAEISQDLKKQDIALSIQRQLTSILAECDLVKFSKFQPNSTSAHLVIVESREVVQETILKANDENLDEGNIPGGGE